MLDRQPSMSTLLRMTPPRFVRFLWCVVTLVAMPAHAQAPPGFLVPDAAQQQQLRDFDRRVETLRAERRRLDARADDAPEAFAAQLAANTEQLVRALEEYQSLLPPDYGLRLDIARQYWILASWTRFRLHRPADAIGYYVASGRFGFALGSVEAAQTWQFDLRDKARALALYGIARASARRATTASDDRKRLAATMELRWHDHQVRNLETGAVFRGPLDEADLAMADFVARTSANLVVPGLEDVNTLAQEVNVAIANDTRAAIDQARLRSALRKAPVSASVLMRGHEAALELDDPDEILRFFARQDPAGYATAAHFMLLDIKQERFREKLRSLPPDRAAAEARYLKPAAAQQAIRRFLREHQVSLDPPAPLPVQ